MVTYETDNELMHHGVLGMKWGVRKAVAKNSKAGTVNVKGPTNIINKHAGAYDRYRVKQEKRKQRASGDSANLKYMTDKERIRYSKGRVKTMGSKAQAIRSESTNFAGRTAKTAGIGLAATLTASLGTACTVASVAKGAVAMNFLLGSLVGGVPLATISIGALSAATIARGTRYVKNVNAIKNVQHK